MIKRAVLLCVLLCLTVRAEASFIIAPSRWNSKVLLPRRISP
jgi:hypothetical protein